MAKEYAQKEEQLEMNEQIAENEQVDFFEDNDDMGVFDEQSNESEKDGAFRRFFGLDKRDIYDNTYDYVKDHVAKNGPIGAIGGFFVAAASVVIHIVQVAIKNLMGEPAHFDLKAAVNRALATELEDQAKNKKQENKARKKEEASTERDEKSAERKGKENKTHDGKSEKNAEQEVNKEEPNHDISEAMQQYLEFQEVYIKDEEKRNKIIDGLLDCKNMKDFQNNFRVMMKNDHSSDRIYLFRKDKENDITEIPYITKKNILEGNITPLNQLFYDKGSNDDHKLEASVKAVLLGAKLKNEMFSCIYSDLREDGYENERKNMMLSSVMIESKNHTSGPLVAMLSQASESVDLYYKSELIGTVDLCEPFENNIEGICKGMENVDKKLEQEVCSIGDDVSFSKVNADIVKVKTSAGEKEFPLKNQSDLKDVADFIQKSYPEKTENECQIDALIIGGRTHPYMERAISEDMYVNPFTNSMAQEGDLILTQKDGFPMISVYQIDSGFIGEKTNFIAGYTESYVGLARIPSNGAKTNLEHVKNSAISRLSVEPGKNIVGIGVMSADEVNRKQSIYESSQVADARNFYEDIKKEAVLDGNELDDLNLTGFDKERDYEEEIPADPAMYEELFNEAQEEEERLRREEQSEDIEL